MIHIQGIYRLIRRRFNLFSSSIEIIYSLMIPVNLYNWIQSNKAQTNKKVIYKNGLMMIIISFATISASKTTNSSSSKSTQRRYRKATKKASIPWSPKCFTIWFTEDNPRRMINTTLKKSTDLCCSSSRTN